ncbi:MAG: hypothetical protein V4450_17845 [Bacteroidota bacterium]
MNINADIHKYFFSFTQQLIMRWSFVVFSVILAALLIAASAIHYPVSVKMNSTMSNIDSPLLELVCSEADSRDNFSKINSGQLVRLRITDNSVHGLDFVAGIVKQVIINKTGDTLRTSIFLPKGLITSGNKEITCHAGMAWDVQIIVSRQSLLKRVFTSSFKPIGK